MELNEADLTLDFIKPKFSFAFEVSRQVDDIRSLFHVQVRHANPLAVEPNYLKLFWAIHHSFDLLMSCISISIYR